MKNRNITLVAMSLLGSLACKPQIDSGSTLAVVNGTEVESEEQARKYTPGAYGIQKVYENASGDIKQQEATGFFTDQKGTTFITNGHVTQLKPPSGYTQKDPIVV